MTSVNVTENKYSLSVTEGARTVVTVTAPSQLTFIQAGSGAVNRAITDKLKDVISPLDFGAVGNGTTDDLIALQAAINAAEAIVGPRTGSTDIEAAYAVVDLGGRKYSISNSLTISEAIVLQNGAIVASSTFPINNYCINIADTAERAVIQRVDIDGGLYTLTRRGNGIKVNAPRVHITRVYVNHFPQFGIRVFTSGSVTTQEVRIENCLVREWQFSEAGRTDFNLRTAKGISIEVADNYVINTTVAQCLRPVYLSGSLNIIDACHFYNGGLDTKTGTYSQSGTTVTVTIANHGVQVNDHVKADYTTGSAVDGHFMVQTADVNTFTLTAASSATNSGNVTIALEPVAVEVDNTVNTVFSGCYFDNGTIDIKTNFKHNITGCHFQDTAAAALSKFIQTFTSATNETVRGLIVTGCNFNGSFIPIAFQVTGSGSYASDIFKQLTWLGNFRGDGGDVYVQAKFGNNAYFEDGNLFLGQNNSTFNFKGIQGITLDADYDNNSGAADSFVEIKIDGTSKFKFDHNGALVPQITTTAIGTNGNPINAMFANSIDVTGNANISGNLTVSGSVTTIDTTTLRVEDKNIELGKVGSPTDTTADGGGITLLGDTNHTFNWLNATDSWTSSEHIALPDNKKLQLGDSQDLQLYHDSNNSVIDNNTGDFYILSAGAFIFQTNNNENAIKCVANGGVELYHDNTLKFTTKSFGATAFGTLTANGGDIKTINSTSSTDTNSFLLANSTGNALQVIHTSSNSYIKNLVGSLFIEPKSGETGIKVIPDGAVELHYDNALKFTTEGTGVKVFGMLVPSASASHPLGIDVLRWNGLFMSSDIDLLDNNKLKFGDNDDLQIYHDGQNSNIDNSTNTLKIKSNRIRLNDFTNDHQMIHAVADGAVELYFDNVQKLRTTSSGITVSGSVTTQDMNMSNLNGTANEVDGSKGSWSIQEGADDLFLINRVSGKKYKFNLTEIS